MKTQHKTIPTNWRLEPAVFAGGSQFKVVATIPATEKNIEYETTLHSQTRSSEFTTDQLKLIVKTMNLQSELIEALEMFCEFKAFDQDYATTKKHAKKLIKKASGIR